MASRKATRVFGPEVPSEELERRVGAAAVNIVHHLMAWLRRRRGEGEEDRQADRLVEAIFNAVTPSLLSSGRAVEHLVMWRLLQDLATIYRRYQLGSLDDDEFRRIIRDYVGLWTPDQTVDHLSLLTPSRRCISDKGGPMQYAKFAVAKLSGIHWKTLHSWSLKVEAEHQSPEIGQPYGIVITPDDISAFVSRQLGSSAVTVEGRARLDGGISVLTLLAAARPSTAQRKPNHRPGPGRPRRRH